MREHSLYTSKQAAKPAAEVEIDDGIQYHRAASAQRLCSVRRVRLLQGMY